MIYTSTFSNKSRKILFFFITFLIGVLFQSCKKEVKSDTLVYSNDFEGSKLDNITGGTIDVFNGTHVLGRYNNGSFSLSVGNLPKHNIVQISFDLYIHDSWDGNNLDNGYAGPDIWRMSVDGDTYVNTTFSNSDCGVDVFCAPQSYPNNYLNSNHNPKTGAYRTDLPGACYLASSSTGTTEYKISKTIDHSSKTVVLQCIDELVQKNVADPKCDESWSVDNIQIKVINL